MIYTHVCGISGIAPVLHTIRFVHEMRATRIIKRKNLFPEGVPLSLQKKPFNIQNSYLISIRWNLAPVGVRMNNTSTTFEYNDSNSPDMAVILKNHFLPVLKPETVPVVVGAVTGTVPTGTNVVVLPE
jgi:hypothetical protein